MWGFKKKLVTVEEERISTSSTTVLIRSLMEINKGHVKLIREFKTGAAKSAGQEFLLGMLTVECAEQIEDSSSSAGLMLEELERREEAAKKVTA